MEKVIHEITDESIQIEAETVLDRRLTDVELENVLEAMREDLVWLAHDCIREVVVTKNTR